MYEEELKYKTNFLELYDKALATYLSHGAGEQPEVPWMGKFQMWHRACFGVESGAASLSTELKMRVDSD